MRKHTRSEDKGFQPRRGEGQDMRRNTWSQDKGSNQGKGEGQDMRKNARSQDKGSNQGGGEGQDTRGEKGKIHAKTQGLRTKGQTKERVRI